MRLHKLDSIFAYIGESVKLTIFVFLFDQITLWQSCLNHLVFNLFTYDDELLLKNKNRTKSPLCLKKVGEMRLWIWTSTFNLLYFHGVLNLMSVIFAEHSFLILIYIKQSRFKHIFISLRMLRECWQHKNRKIEHLKRERTLRYGTSSKLSPI